ncbi:aspartyl protease family protein [Allosphingosinicella vermicomposti]|uniref:aspartyl protease family protein n=1 Tax=Allosphingosinicella vermicomposti TaxID=614671 RepID=UPI00131A4DCB|nr:aspartyl protease family protein [Allosphingosinicella vermicomposti]
MKSIALLIASLVSAPAAQALPSPVEAKLSPWIQRLKTVEVMIDGHPAKMLFDSGGAVTLVTPAFAKKIGCDPYGRLTGFNMAGTPGYPKKCGQREIRIGAYKTRIDLLSGDNLGPPGAPEIDGILSLDAFADQKLTIDLSGDRIVIETEASLQKRVGNRPPVPIRIMRAMGGLGLTTFAKVQGPKGDLWFLIDSNNQARTRVSPGALEEFGIAGNVVSEAVANVKTIPLDIRIEGVEEGPTDVAPKDIIYDGVLNERFVYWHNVTLDLKEKRAWYVFDPKSEL